MNDLDLCLEVVSKSCLPLRYIWRWISRKPLEIEAWFQGPPIWNCVRVSNGHVTDDVTWPQRCCEAVRCAVLATAWLLVTSVDLLTTSTVKFIARQQCSEVIRSCCLFPPRTRKHDVFVTFGAAALFTVFVTHAQKYWRAFCSVEFCSKQDLHPR